MNYTWAFITSWFTPTYLFLPLNLIIATIFIRYRFGSQRRPEQQQLGPVPYVLDRVRSINFSLYKFKQPNADPIADQFLLPTGPKHVNTPYPVPDHPPTQIARSTSDLLERLKSINLSSLYRSDSSSRESEFHHPTDLTTDADHLVRRSKSDKGVVGAPERTVEKIKKSASEKLVVGSSEEKETASLEDDEEVDVKADNFILMFKQQLRLQRLDSLLRYRDLLKRN
ncbi:pathogen-associated molecular patterns-induced protein A70-like [Juglans regia]|uniref:Pathogen-associated molecular patterns-induced protein A70-like n=1 Tax=Juglans regia TaxID=51240 RepID=A0A2I4GMH9_JUGRE|nr:pathogen-associated molecular patterns-induced protein A70-like [Juglans regia]